MFDRLQVIIAETLGVANVSQDAHFMNDLGADSLDMVELIFAIEEEFDIEIPEDTTLETVQQVLDYLSEVA